MHHNQSGRSFLRKKVQMRRDFLTTCTQKSTQGAKLQADVALFGSHSYNVCLNLFQMAKLRSAFLWQTLFSKTTIGGIPSQFANRIFGDDYCVNNCLKDLTLEKMRDLCNVCDDTTTCYFYFLWNYRPSGNS